MEVSMSKTRRGKYTDNRICYISKCKGDMRLYLRRKGKLSCFNYLVRGKSFSFYRGKIQKKRVSMVTYTLFLYLNVITFCFQYSLCRSMKGLEPLCASTTTASVQSLTIQFHCGHVICKNSLQGLLDVCIHCFHNRYPFLKN